MGNHFQMHHEPHQGCDIIHVQQPWHLLASATHQSGFMHLPEAARSENSPETTVPLTRPAPAFAVFPHLTARLQPPAAPRTPSGAGEADLEPRPPPASLCLWRAPHPSGPAGSAPAGKGLRRGRDSPSSRSRRSEGAGAPGGAQRGWGSATGREREAPGDGAAASRALPRAALGAPAQPPPLRRRTSPARGSPPSDTGRC